MAADPAIWILSRGRKGDLDQMLALAKAMGWPHEVKTLRFAGPDIPVLSNLLLKEKMSPPWPDLVLCAEASPSVIARGIKRLSPGTRIVCLGRPAGAPGNFDLILTTAQYRIPAAANLVELSMPLTGVAEASARKGAGPVALAVGGPAFPDLLDAAAAERLAADALAHAAKRGQVLDVVTSPRTPPGAIAVLERSIVAPHRLTLSGHGTNHYKDALAEASEIIVTSDSVSMVADALASGKPVSIYPLPQALNAKWKLGSWLYRNSVEAPQALMGPVRWLFNAGVIEVAPDRRKLFARLVAEGRIGWFGEAVPPPQPGAARRDLEIAVKSLRELMSRP
ncbi:MAG: mitochondrial fission ELM1 family protein [Aestuariivirga sp.]|uniref:ELM1/GtrOC1 family putative glycosyltransferase n=1 Tax=Aestuariivirga sp. TaxID=2650926 RepID=UPI0025BEFB66|nr:ELM1/GtrOC1 family putative glycosyltransferase [Aestuariivirga sp.]MCA3559501.1 mitochondrial fission ELM1 family protein [Aestuariivirga sp.]